MERFDGGVPGGGGGETEDGGVGLAFGGDDGVPFARVDAAAAGHVALAGEDEDRFGWRSGIHGLGFWDFEFEIGNLGVVL